MKPLWHPISAVLVESPPCLATPELVRMLLRAGGLRLIYAGDRMWPALKHGERVSIVPLDARLPPPGSVVLTATSGIPDLLRVDDVSGGRIRVAADGDPGSSQPIDRDEILAGTDLPRRAIGERGRLRRRLALELREARRNARTGDDPALTVREKYDYQAPFYSRASGADLEARLLSRVRDNVAPGGRILVIGSGTGRECFALAAAGWQVHGIDFSPAMVEHARREGRQRGLEVAFEVGDVRSHREPAASLAAVLFTYDVYSFLPVSGRVDVLRLARSWLTPGGVAFLSARRVHGLYERCVLTLQWWHHRRDGGTRWGDSHTRWIGGDGTLHRSFVHVFGHRALEREIREGGFGPTPWIAGHAMLRPNG